MFSKNQIKEIVNQGIESGEILIPSSGGTILTLDLDGVSSGDAIPLTDDFATLIQIMNKEVDAAGVYLIIDKPYMKIEGYPVWRDNGTKRICEMQFFNSLSSGEGMLASDEWVYYKFYIDWEDVARVTIESVSP